MKVPKVYNEALYLLFCVLLLSLLAVTAIPAPAPAPASAPGPNASRIGGWQPIKNISDPHVQEIAHFAVTEYNKQSKAELKLVKVLKGKTQLVAGQNYKLILAAKNETTTNDYEAFVYERWDNFKELISFKPVNS